MIRFCYFALLSLVLSACGGGGGGGGNGNDTPPDTGTPVEISLALTDNGIELPSDCQFSNSTVRKFSPQCDINFTINTTGTIPSTAALVGQYSIDNGISWTNLVTSASLEFVLPLNNLPASVMVRGIMADGNQTTSSPTRSYSIASNSVGLGNELGDFAQSNVVSLSDEDDSFSIQLPDCIDDEGDGVEVEIFNNSQFWFTQQPLAEIELDAAQVTDSTTIQARCRDKLSRDYEIHEKTVDAPGAIFISKGDGNLINQAPIVQFQPVSALRFSGQIRDQQTVQVCFVAVDADGDTLTNSLAYQFDTSPEQPAALTLNCADIPITDQGDQRLTVFARSFDGVALTEETLDLGVIYQDTIQQANALNSRCVPGDEAQSVSVSVNHDGEFDPYTLQVIDASSQLVLRDLGQVTASTISFPCDDLGQTQYFIRNLSRGLVSDSINYTHSVTAQANREPEVDITIPVGNVIGLRYRDNQDITVCAEATDADGDATTLSLSYRFEQEATAVLPLVDNCAQLTTEGRGGQELVFFAEASDGFTTVTETRNAGFIYADTIQFPESNSGNCVLAGGDASYSVIVDADSEGDSHQLSVVNADTLAVIDTLGSVTSGQFNLPCDVLGTTRFQINNTSRGLAVSSVVYSHVVTEQVNQPPSLEIEITGEQFGEQYRDQQTLDVCFISEDPEGLPVAIDASYLYGSGSVVALALDNNNCAQISTLNRGNQNLTVFANSSDGLIDTSLTSDLGVIYLDTIQVAFTTANACEQSTTSLDYTVEVADDTEGDAIDLTVFDASNNSQIAALGASAPFEFSLSCATLGTTEFYVANRSRGLTTLSLIYTHDVGVRENRPPEIEVSLNGVEEFSGQVRDNQTIEICISEFDADGDNLTTSLSYQYDDFPAIIATLSNNCADVSTQGQGGRTLSITASTSDGLETVTVNPQFDIHRDTVQFPSVLSGSQVCRISDPSIRYTVITDEDIESDDYTLEVIDAASGSVLETLSNDSISHFLMSCASAGLTEFYIRNTSREIAVQSITYQHLVSNVINNQPTINLSLNNDAEFTNGGVLRDNQIIEVCASVLDLDAEPLTTQIFYQFDNEPEQMLALTNLCGTIDLNAQGGKQLVINGFVGDGTATTVDSLEHDIHEDTLNIAFSSSGNCRVGDNPRQYATLVASDAEGDIYSIDVINVNTDQVLASLGQVTAGNFTLPCDEQGATNFAIRTTSRGQTRLSLIYSHVVSDTLNSAPTAGITVTSGEQFQNQYRDNQNIAICITGADADDDALTYSAAYRFDENAFTNLPLSSEHCGVINTTGQGGNNLVIQGFVNDGQIETTIFSDLGEIHTDTIQTAVSVSSECTLGEEALRYSVLVPDDLEADANSVTVVNYETSAVIADLGMDSQGEFTLDCSDLGITSFVLVNDSRGIQSTSEVFTHRVNASLTNTVAVYLTTADQFNLVTKQDDEELRVGSGSAPFQVDVDHGDTFQTIDAFGATLTDSAASLIQGSEMTDAIISQLFSQDIGIGLTGVRYPMSGMSEFVSRVANSYNDRPAGLTDPDLDFFSTAADNDFMIPTLQGILAQNQQIDLIATNWSAPGWMKDSDSLQGGSLREEFSQSYANYYLQFFETYRDLDIEFKYLSIQNQPHEESDFPTMRWDSNSYRDFLLDYLEPTLQQQGIAPNYLAWDGNWTDNDTQDPNDIGIFARAVAQNANATRFVTGTAWQCYQANNGFDDYSQALELMASVIPDKKLFLTECGNSEDGRSFGEVLSTDVGDMFIGSLRRSVHAIYYNSLVLDDAFGPHQGGCSDCRGVITLDGDDNITFNPEYYALAHFSQFIAPGAVRVESTTFDDQLETAAFLNEDGSLILVATNRTNADIAFDLNWSGQFFNYNLAAQSVVTFKWSSNNAPLANEQQVAQASQIASDTYDLIQQVREPVSGVYRSHYELVGVQDAQLSPAATGFGLIGLSIAFEMNWQPNAATQIIATLDALNGEVDGFTPERNDFGFFKARMDDDGTNASLTEFSVTETAQLVAGAVMARNVFASNTDIVSKVDTLMNSIDWSGVVIDADAGTVATIQNQTGSNTASQGVYGEQMLTTWLAQGAGDVAAIAMWDNYYESGEVFERYVYSGFDVPADDNSDPVSTTTQQLNFYLVNDAISSANYRTLMREQAMAEKQFWQDSFSENSYIWGFGYGENTFADATPHFDTLVDHPGNMAHAPAIAGFVITDITILEDFLAWDDANLGLVTNQATLDQIPWRYSQQTPGWTATTVEIQGLAPQLMGLASHPGLLDISFFRANTVLPE